MSKVVRNRWLWAWKDSERIKDLKRFDRLEREKEKWREEERWRDNGERKNWTKERKKNKLRERVSGLFSWTFSASSLNSFESRTRRIFSFIPSLSLSLFLFLSFSLLNFSSSTLSSSSFQYQFPLHFFPFHSKQQSCSRTKNEKFCNGKKIVERKREIKREKGGRERRRRKSESKAIKEKEGTEIRRRFGWGEKEKRKERKKRLEINEKMQSKQKDDWLGKETEKKKKFEGRKKEGREKEKNKIKERVRTSHKNYFPDLDFPSFSQITNG